MGPEFLCWLFVVILQLTVGGQFTAYSWWSVYSLQFVVSLQAVYIYLITLSPCSPLQAWQQPASKHLVDNSDSSDSNESSDSSHMNERSDSSDISNISDSYDSRDRVRMSYRKSIAWR